MTRPRLPGAGFPAATRARQVTSALRLVCASVAFGAVSGIVSVTAGLGDHHSLGAFGVGLGVLADVTGSAVLIWRFRAAQAWRTARGRPARSR
ncbi:MAG TPA: hypothetical protein VMV92_37420 [Streptosporangiaceae bacterium]|nr:hypothetical protein [Streptosporangiaceae bacterium]